MYPPPPGVDESEYIDYHFYGECGVDVASLGVGGDDSGVQPVSQKTGRVKKARDDIPW